MSQLALELIAKEKEDKTGRIDLSNCNLTTLPNELWELVHLKELVLDNNYWNSQTKKWVTSINKGAINRLVEIPIEIKELTSLKALFIGNNRLIKDLTILSELTQLQALDLRFNNITDANFLSTLTDLQTLNLSANQITDAGFLSTLTGLRTLNLSANQITDYSFLSALTDLQTLNLSANQITDYSFLSTLTDLQTLNLSFNQITDAGFLSTLTGLQNLYISANQITDAGFLSTLTNLQSLDLSVNQITDAGFLSTLTGLQNLYLRENQITDAGFLSTLTDLQSLDLGNNKITDYSFLSMLTNLKTLNLGNNKITDAHFLSTLTGLQTLNLRFNKIADASFLSMLTGLRTLYLYDNQITDAGFLSTLTDLQSLDLGNNKITDYSFLSTLTNLKNLNLSANQITDYSFLSTLTGLHTLYLNNNKITDAGFLSTLTGLQSLDLSNNQITDASSLSMLTNLKTLNLGNNKITDAGFVSTLTGLQSLDLNNNKITDAHFLSTLTGLHTLYLYDNQITDYSFMSTLTGLQNLNLNDNKITDAGFVSTLTGLQSLDLSNNQITDVSFVSTLTGLHTLDLGNNQITDAGFLSTLTGLHTLYLGNNQITDAGFLSTLTGLRTLYLYDNPIYEIIPLEIREEETRIILEWIRNQSHNTKKISLRQVKVLLLGNTNVGKSFLLYYLENEQVPEQSESTFGLVYKALKKFDGVRLHIYDFGGQEYFHATHKLFFSEDALHLLLWSKEDEQRQGQSEACFELAYWLRCIQQLAKGTQNEASIETLLIENKIDKQNYTPTLIDFEDLQKKFKELRINYIAVSIQENKRLKGLLELIEERIVALATLQENYTQPYQDVIDKIILNRKKGKLVTSPDKLLNEHTRNSMKVFHNLGIVLYYPDVLSDKVFIEPQAFLDLLYKTILHENAQKNKGRLFISDIEKAIKNNDLGLSLDEIIRLLKYFDVIFQVKNGSDAYFAPQYLPDKSSSMLAFFAKYYFKRAVLRIESDSFLLNLVILKIFGEYGKDVKGDEDYLFWRDGIVIEKYDQVLYIQYNRAEHYIDLYGDIENKNWALQKDVVDFIIRIPLKEGKFKFEKTSKYDNIKRHPMGLNIPPGIEVYTVVPWPWEENRYFNIFVSVDGKHFALWKDLQQAKMPHFSSGGVDFNLKDFRFYLKNKQIMKKVFISYSKDDLSLVNEFLKQLASLERSGTISTWYCTQLVAGSEWDAQIQAEFDSSDIVCFMVSPNFMATDYIYNYELKKAIDRKKTDPSFKIIPIILNYCLWMSDDAYNLGKYTALPYIAKPVCDFHDRQQAWYIIVSCINIMIKEDLKNEGDDTFSNPANPAKFPKDIIKLFERIIAGELDNNKARTKD